MLLSPKVREPQNEREQRRSGARSRGPGWGLGANLHSTSEGFESGVSTVLTVTHTCSRTVTCVLMSNLSLSSTFCSIQGPGLLKDVVMSD